MDLMSMPCSIKIEHGDRHYPPHFQTDPVRCSHDDLGQGSWMVIARMPKDAERRHEQQNAAWVDGMWFWTIDVIFHVLVGDSDSFIAAF